MSRNPPTITANEALHRLQVMTVNLLLSRSIALQGGSLDSATRNLDKECQWPEIDPTLEQYQKMYDRVSIARRVVQVHPEETWSVYPELYEVEDERVTAFERQWNAFVRQTNCWHYLHRVDEQSGIGQFGVLLIGLDDGLKLDQPAKGIDKNGKKVGKSPKKVTFLRPFPQRLVKIKTYDTNVNSPRFTQPLMYNITLSDPNAEPSDVDDETPTPGTSDVDVHWTRILHIADNRESSDTHGTPRLKSVYNDILDLRKVKGSSAEMFYKGGFPGLSFEALPEVAITGILDKESLKKEIAAYSAGLQRYMRLVGMTAKSLAPQVADPSNHLVGLLQLICAAIKVPLRVFMGSEAGHLASQQDSVTWNRRLQGRQSQYINPMIIDPFVRRLMLLDVLPEVDSYIIQWRDLNNLSDTDKAKVSLQKAQAILQYVTSNSAVMIPPYMFLTRVLMFSDKEAKAIIDAAGGEAKMVKTINGMQQLQSSKATSGKNPAKSTGAGGRRNGLGRPKK
jgi:hypothetical protein